MWPRNLGQVWIALSISKEVEKSGEAWRRWHLHIRRVTRKGKA
jgi:hypothetical protein